MLDPHPYSDQEHRDIHKLELRPPYEEGSAKLFENTLQAAAPSRMNRPGEGTSELGLGSHSMEEGFEARSNPQRVCRICHRQFSSGRALGGHMRVHGPLFIPAAGRKRKLILTDSDSEGGGEQEEGEGEEAVLDAAASLSIEADSDFLRVNRITGDLLDGDHADGDGYRVVGTEYYMAAHDKEHGSSYSLDVSRSSELADYDSMAKKNALYELRHNPKKSRRFTDEDLSTRMLASAHGMTMNSPSKSSLLPTSERTRVCSVCGKEFWSWKALSGHMRCHPEREWRGVLPPTGKAGSRYNYQKRSYVVSSFGESSDVERVSDVEDKDDVEAAAGMGLPLPVSKRLFEEEEIIQDGGDLKDCVSSPNTADYDSNSFWPTGKRSRRRSGDMKARSLQSSPQQVHGDPALIASETTSLADLGEEQHFQVHNFLFMLAEAAQAIEGGFADAGKSNMFVFKGTSASEQDAQAFLADSKDIGNAKAGTMKFECSTCKRSFNSPQALGGHRASHRKTKGCFARTSMGEEESAEQLGREFAPLRHGFSKEKDSMKKEKQQQQVQSYNKGYECSVCHRVFLTGQALGGHKSRCHFTGEKVAEAAASVMSSNKQLPRRGHSSKHDDGSILDLNLPASTIEDGEVRSEAIELNLFTSDQVSEVERKVDTWTTDSPREELSLGAPWAAKHSSRSTSWELEGRWPAVEPGMAF